LAIRTKWRWYIKEYLIIGNGVAGTTAAEHLRKADEGAAISIISEEDLPFYYRIRLNEYLSADINEEQLIARPFSWYEKNRITLVTTAKVVDANPVDRSIAVEDGRRFTYDCLLIATGSHSYIPPIAGTDKQGVFCLRTVEDARRIINYSRKVQDVVLIGGGLLGLEAGNALRKTGKRITVVEFLPRLLPRQLDVKGAGKLARLMEQMGFTFRLDSAVREITGERSVDGVLLAGGETISCGMVIISAGVRPNLDIAQKLGVQCNKGILVDSNMKTSLPQVFAAGDVAEHDGRVYGIWPAAMQQGRVAGVNMAGVQLQYEGTVMANILKVVGIDLASAGEIDADNKLFSQIEETDNNYRKLVIDNGKLVGCIMLGDTKDFAKATRAMAEHTDVDQLTLGRSSNKGITEG
jgi:nitrite reductase (NADH) large subunit